MLESLTDDWSLLVGPIGEYARQVAYNLIVFFQKPDGGERPIAITSLDHALSAIEKKKTVTTVTKTSADWDQFKEKEGISDELEQATKDG